MKMSTPNACHVIGDGCHSLDRLSCQAIHNGPIRLRRHIIIPFNKLSNDFVVHISHFVDHILDQGVHHGHPNDDECRGHHNLHVSLLRRGQRGCQCDDLASHGPQRQQAFHGWLEIQQEQILAQQQTNAIHDAENNKADIMEQLECSFDGRLN